METSDILQKKITEAPEEIRNLLITRKWSPIVEEVVVKNNLSPEQKDALENEILFVLLGLEPTSNFEMNIQTNAKLSQNTASYLAREIRIKVFGEVEALLPKEEEPTLQSIPDNRPETQELAPQVIVEQSHAPANLIQAPPEEELIEAPELSTSPSSLSPGQGVPQAKPANLIEEKLSQVVASSGKSPYPGGVDPYREPTN